jgi:chromosome segregation ATPase
MKLLSPKIVKDNKNQEISRSILRVQEARKIEEEIRLKMINAEADFKSMLAGQKERWAKEEENHSKDVLKMQTEIKELEERRKSLLEPIEIVKNRADLALKEASEYLYRIKEKEVYNEELSDKLEEKLDELGDREEKIKKAEGRQSIERANIELQKDIIDKGIKDLNNKVIDFMSEKSKAYKDIDERKSALFLFDRTLTTKEENLKIKEKELIDYSVRLHDERGILDRAWAELKRKGGNIPLINK